AASTGLLLYMAVQKPEKEWYGCRALAESIKTSTWRYMMRAELSVVRTFGADGCLI
ncbi:TPA: SLATT domain-containing protein, partial [Escherichia coli]|nr:SLATT domain-containing protein [Escherichia coli]